MSALPTRADLAGDPSRATLQTQLLAIYDMLAQRLAAGTTGAGTASAPELLLARNSLGLGAGADIASAATVDFTARTGNLVIVTGTIEITSATMSNGDDFTVIAADALPINIAGVLRYTCRAGDMVRFSQDRTGVQRAGIVSRTPPGVFHKTETTSVVFTKTGADTLSIKAGTVVDVAGVSINFTTATAVVMPALTAGTDYAIYACADGTVRADASFTAPSGYTSADSRLIGGFHYGRVAPGTTLASGSFNTAGSVQTGGMVWTQTDVDNIAGINKFSLWDLKWRANVSDLRAQRGFVLTDAGTWVAIYFASTNTDSNGLSKYNTDVASGTVLAKIPAVMGGNGTLTYGDGNWWRFSELARAYGARLLTDAEASIAFFGVTENQSLGGAASTIPLTTRQAGYTSKYGVEQATGHHWTWGDDSAGTAATAYVANGGRGRSYANSTVKVILGGSRDDAANSGSRTSNWGNVPTLSNWNVGLRAACDHLMLA